MDTIYALILVAKKCDNCTYENIRLCNKTFRKLILPRYISKKKLKNLSDDIISRIPYDKLCMIKYLSIGAIPYITNIGLKYLANIKYLEIKGNHDIKGEDILHFTRLKYLKLKNTPKIRCKDLNNFKNLEILYLDNTCIDCILYISGIPKSCTLSNMNKLVNLKIKNNCCISSYVCYEKPISNLYISNCFFDLSYKFYPEQIDVKNLKSLILCGDCERFDISNFSNFDNIKKLTLKNTTEEICSNIMNNIDKLYKLEILKIFNTPFIDDNYIELLKERTNIKKLAAHGFNSNITYKSFEDNSLKNISNKNYKTNKYIYKSGLYRTQLQVNIMLVIILILIIIFYIEEI